MQISLSTYAVTNEELLPHLLEAIKSMGEEKKWEGKILMVGEGSTSLVSANQMIDTDQDPNSVERVKFNLDDDVCVLPFSSGTTGIPKGVMLTHHNIVGNVCQGTHGPNEIAILPEATDDFQPTTVSVLPLYHAFAMNITMTPTLYRGGKLVMMPSFKPDTFARALAKYKPTFLHLAPPLVSFLASSPLVRKYCTFVPKRSVFSTKTLPLMF